MSNVLRLNTRPSNDDKNPQNNQQNSSQNTNQASSPKQNEEAQVVEPKNVVLSSSPQENLTPEEMRLRRLQKLALQTGQNHPQPLQSSPTKSQINPKPIVKTQPQNIPAYSKISNVETIKQNSPPSRDNSETV